MALLFLESIGTTELLLILVVALVVFGPRRLPDIGRKIGKAMAEFRRASDDFKRTWEYEVEIDRRRPAAEEPAPAVRSGTYGDTSAALPTYNADAGDFGGSHSQTNTPEPTVARAAAGEDEHAWDVATGRAMTRPAEKDDDEVNAS